ncbi:unnamed protein product [Sympodiomycopsis kandeliae]
MKYNKGHLANIVRGLLFFTVDHAPRSGLEALSKDELANTIIKWSKQDLSLEETSRGILLTSEMEDKVSAAKKAESWKAKGQPSKGPNNRRLLSKKTYLVRSAHMSAARQIKKSVPDFAKKRKTLKAKIFRFLHLQLIQKANCYLCSVELQYEAYRGKKQEKGEKVWNPANAVIDRIVPGSGGGEYSEGNMGACCHGCNTQKLHYTLEEASSLLWVVANATLCIEDGSLQSGQPRALPPWPNAHTSQCGLRNRFAPSKAATKRGKKQKIVTITVEDIVDLVPQIWIGGPLGLVADPSGADLPLAIESIDRIESAQARTSRSVMIPR